MNFVKSTSTHQKMENVTNFTAQLKNKNATPQHLKNWQHFLIRLYSNQIKLELTSIEYFLRFLRVMHLQIRRCRNQRDCEHNRLIMGKTLQMCRRDNFLVFLFLAEKKLN